MWTLISTRMEATVDKHGETEEILMVLVILYVYHLNVNIVHHMFTVLAQNLGQIVRKCVSQKVVLSIKLSNRTKQ